MTTKEYLESYQSIRAEKLNLLSERNLIVIDEALPPGMDYSSDRVQTSPSDQMADRIQRIIKRTQEIDKRIREINAEMLAIKAQINSMEYGLYKRILWLKYIEEKSWGEISLECHLDETYIRGELHGKSLIDFEKTLQNLTKPYKTIQA